MQGGRGWGSQIVALRCTMHYNRNSPGDWALIPPGHIGKGCSGLLASGYRIGPSSTHLAEKQGQGISGRWNTSVKTQEKTAPEHLMSVVNNAIISIPTP